MIRTYKRKLMLTKAQEERMSSWMGAARLVYNMGMEIKNTSYRATGKNVGRFELGLQIKTLNDIPWMKDVPSQVLHCSLRRLDLAYQKFFKTIKSGGGFPRYASKRTHKSISAYEGISVTGNVIRIPKMGKIKMFKDSLVVGKIKFLTIKKEVTGHFAYIVCIEVPQKINSDNQAIGLDMGISSFFVDSDGNSLANPKHFQKYERKLRIENRSLARKKKGSNSWIKQCQKVSKLHQTVGNVRRDFLHKESTRIAKKYNMVYVEGLKIQNMAKNKTLSKHILDCGWGAFRAMLEYKTNVIRVSPKHSSQTCFECGTIDAKSRISQAEFCCTACGHVSHADVNAAKNILSRGTALSRKREPIGCALALENSNVYVGTRI